MDNSRSLCSNGKEPRDPVAFFKSIADDLGAPKMGDESGVSLVARIGCHFGFDMGFIYTVDATLGDELYLAASFGEAGHANLPQEIERSSVADAAARSDEYLSACLKDELFGWTSAVPGRSVSLASFPVFDVDRLIGAVGIASSRGTVLDDRETTLARIALSLAGAEIRAGHDRRRKRYFRDSLERAIDSTGVDIYVVDFYTHAILYMNRSMAAPYGTPEELLGKKCYTVLYQDQIGECDFCPKKMLIDDSGNPTKVYSWDYQRPFDGSWFRVFSAAFNWEEGKLAHVITSTNITENKKNEFLVERMAMYDALTGIPNRRSFERDFERMIDDALRAGKTGFILFLDLDNFKHINDAFGHEKGDELLISVAAYLDSFSNKRQQVYRYGGDEFILLLEDIERDTVGELVDLFLYRFAESWELGGLDYFCTASIGVASFPADGVTFDVLLNAADKAMYEAKRQGKSMAVYAAGDTGRQSAEMEFEFALRRAVLDGCGEFEVLFHPVADIHTGLWTGVEALARWNSSAYGTVGPERFIPVCENLGLIFDLEKWLLTNAVREVASWDAPWPDFFLSFNVSAMEFSNDEFGDYLLVLAKRYGYPYRGLMLEIAESTPDFTLRLEEIRGRLEFLRKQGISVALDGFGIGYNSLERVQELAVDFIKIDRKFVTDFMDDDIRVAMVRAIIMLAGAAKAKVCAEGVESAEHLECLRDVGCDYVQGRYFLLPSPGREMLAALRANREGNGA